MNNIKDQILNKYEIPLTEAFGEFSQKRDVYNGIVEEYQKIASSIKDKVILKDSLIDAIDKYAGSISSSSGAWTIEYNEQIKKAQSALKEVNDSIDLLTSEAKRVKDELIISEKAMTDSFNYYKSIEKDMSAEMPPLAIEEVSTKEIYKPLEIEVNKVDELPTKKKGNFSASFSFLMAGVFLLAYFLAKWIEGRTQ